MFRPNEAAQMTTALRLPIPTAGTAYGVAKKTYTNANGVIMANFKTFGGTEKVVNDVLSIEDTAQVVCWYRPDLKAGCRLVRLSDGASFDVLGDPENIEMRNQFLKFKVSRVKGGA